MVVVLAGGIGQLKPTATAKPTVFSSWSMILSSGNLIYTNDNRSVIAPDANPQAVAGTLSRNSGKHYFEIVFNYNDWGTARQSAGVVVMPWTPFAPIGNQGGTVAMVNFWGADIDGNWAGQWILRQAGWDVGWGSLPGSTVNCVIGVAVDFNFAGFVCAYFNFNGTWMAGGSGFTSVFNPNAVDYNFGSGLTILPACSVANVGTATLNVGNDPFLYAPPDFTAWG